jgi:hypothetical protein
MIPPFDPSSGNLPPGVHTATWAEIAARFGYTPHRLALLAGLKAALDVLKTAGGRRAYLDGSFVTAKEAHFNAPPGDYDACWETTGVDFPALALAAPVLFDFRPGRPAQEATYGGEFFPAEVPADAAGRVFLDYFQHDKRTGDPQGIVAIDLGGLP